MTDYYEINHYIELELDCNDPLIWLDDDGEVTDEQHAGPYASSEYAHRSYCGFDDLESYERACQNAQKAANEYGVMVTLHSTRTQCNENGEVIQVTNFVRNGFEPETIDEEDDE